MHYLFLGMILLGTLVSYPQQAEAACTASEQGNIRHLACPIGQYGVRSQRCNASLLWEDMPGSPCPIIQCTGGINIGETKSNSSNCPSYFTDVKAAGASNFTETCLLPLENSAAGLLYVTQTTCKPQYTSCLGSGSRILPCPVNTAFPTNQQPGQITQKCDGSKYQTVEDTCMPPTCNGQPVGSYRSFKGKKCPAGRKGTLLEICTRSGKWEVSLANCGKISTLCPAGYDPVSRVTWGAALPGTTASTAACGGTCPWPNGFPATAITRDCSATGMWQAASSVCP